MKIIVCMKAVPSTNQVRLDPVTHTICRDGRQAVVNPFDASALETAVGIKERLGGQVTVLSMGIPDTERLLRDALSRGADTGILLSDRAFAGADTLATSYSLSLGVKEAGGYQMILCGKMAVDGDTAQIGPELAGVLGIPCVTDVCEILHLTDKEVQVKKGVDDGHQILKVKLPVLLTVEKDICMPRMPSIAGIRYGETGPVAVKGTSELAADPMRIGLTGSPTQVIKTFTPKRQSESIPISGTPGEQASQLAILCKEVSR